MSDQGQQPMAPGTLSPDGLYVWDGYKWWEAASVPIGTSLDGGQTVWDGHEWSTPGQPLPTSESDGFPPESDDYQPDPAAVEHATHTPKAPGGLPVWVPWVAGGVGGIILGVILAAMFSGGGSDSSTTSAAPAPTVTVTATKTATQAAEPGPTVTVTKAAPAPQQTAATQAAPASGTIGDGSWTVGADMPPGQWKTTKPVTSGCYWEISRAGSNGTDLLSNDNVSGGIPRVKVQVGQEFKSEGCGDWTQFG